MATLRKARSSSTRRTRKNSATPTAPTTARSVMTADPVTILDEASLLDAAAKMAELGVRHLPVVDATGVLIGMISDRDVRSVIGNPSEALRGNRSEWEEQCVADVMAPDPVRAELDATVSDIAAILTDERIGAVPVVDEGDRPVGIVSYVDLIDYLARKREP